MPSTAMCACISRTLHACCQATCWSTSHALTSPLIGGRPEPLLRFSADLPHCLSAAVITRLRRLACGHPRLVRITVSCDRAIVAGVVRLTADYAWMHSICSAGQVDDDQLAKRVEAAAQAFWKLTRTTAAVIGDTGRDAKYRRAAELGPTPACAAVAPRKLALCMADTVSGRAIKRGATSSTRIQQVRCNSCLCTTGKHSKPEQN